MSAVVGCIDGPTQALPSPRGLDRLDASTEVLHRGGVPASVRLSDEPAVATAREPEPTMILYDAPSTRTIASRREAEPTMVLAEPPSMRVATTRQEAQPTVVLDGAAFRSQSSGSPPATTVSSAPVMRELQSGWMLPLDSPPPPPPPVSLLARPAPRPLPFERSLLLVVIAAAIVLATGVLVGALLFTASERGVRHGAAPSLPCLEGRTAPRRDAALGEVALEAQRFPRGHTAGSPHPRSRSQRSMHDADLSVPSRALV